MCVADVTVTSERTETPNVRSLNHHRIQSPLRPHQISRTSGGVSPSVRACRLVVIGETTDPRSLARVSAGPDDWRWMIKMMMMISSLTALGGGRRARGVVVLV